MENAKKVFLFLFETVKIIVISLAIVIPIRYFLFQPFVVQGESMQPSFSTGDYLIVDQISYRFKEPQRGEVIILRSPSEPSQRLIKRVIGLPSEGVEIKEGDLAIIKEGERLILEEDYLFNGSLKGDFSILLNENEYFVLGDNRDFSYDSRRFGVIKKENIIGRVLFRLLPVSSVSKIEAPSY
ncbi:MAG: signal peptidase I [Candidatus Paceibacterota bacterium]